MDLEISNLKIFTPTGKKPIAGGNISKFKGSINIKNGRIVSIGKPCKANETFDGKGMVAIPGFVDPHTHIPFYGERSKEFVMRATGKTYVEILKSGGGIHSTVNMVRSTSIDDLVRENKKYLKWMLRAGVTSLECKSGYGLDLENELKQLKTIKKLAKEVPQTLIPTFLGAHAVPPEKDEDAYITEIFEMLKVIKSESLANFVDVFCDEGAFSVENASKLLKRAKEWGFKIRAHAEELSSNGFASVAAELGAVSVDHIIKIEESEIPTLKKHGTIALLMPTTSFYLKTTYAPARKLIDEGVPVALGSDFNPGSNTFYSPLFLSHLAVNWLGMTPVETLTAQTLNAACVLGIENEVGSIENGKKADIVILDMPDLEYMSYMPTNEIVKAVFKNGRKVFENRSGVSW